jgi:biopolymer transport protein ExbB
METMNLITIFKLNPYIMVALLICSILVVAYTFERAWAFMRTGSMSNTTAERIKQHVRQGQIKEAIAASARDRGFIGHALEVALNAAHYPREEMESIFALYRMKLQGALNKNLAVFGTIAFTGPLIGLLGTVLGVIRAFRDLAISGSGGPSIVAAGIAEALFTTGGGIGVAVIAAVMYNMFTSVARSKVQYFDQITQEVAILNYTGREKGHH